MSATTNATVTENGVQIILSGPVNAVRDMLKRVRQQPRSGGAGRHTVKRETFREYVANGHHVDQPYEDIADTIGANKQSVRTWMAADFPDEFARRSELYRGGTAA